MEKKFIIIFIIIFAVSFFLGFSAGSYSTAKFGMYVAGQILDIKFKPEFVTFLTSERYKIDRYASLQNITNKSLF